jgi:hypothetical protein
MWVNHHMSLWSILLSVSEVTELYNFLVLNISTHPQPDTCPRKLFLYIYCYFVFYSVVCGFFLIGFPFWCSNTWLQSSAHSSSMYQFGSSVLWCAGSLYRWRRWRCGMVFCKYYVGSMWPFVILLTFNLIAAIHKFIYVKVKESLLWCVEVNFCHLLFPYPKNVKSKDKTQYVVIMCR